MRPIGHDVMRLGLDTMKVTKAHKLFGDQWRGIGAIFMLHRVVDHMPSDDAFAPNRILEVTADFLDAVIGLVKAQGYDIVTLDEAAHRLRAGGPGPFAAFTFDDGYKDNLDLALPVFELHGAPFTVYVTTGLPDQEIDLWWLTLEAVINKLDHVSVAAGYEVIDAPARTPAEKRAAWDAIYWALRASNEFDTRHAVTALAESAGVDGMAIARQVAMNWDEIRKLHAHPLATIGAHTTGHFALAHLSREQAYEEMHASVARLQTELGEKPRHFAYPYGDPDSARTREFEMATEAGFATAVTTRKGLLHPAHGNHLRALPRLSLNGNFQDLGLVDILLGGAPFALWNRFKKLDVA